MKRFWLALIWLMPLLLLPGEVLLYNYLFAAYHDFFVIGVNASFNILTAAVLAHLLHRFYGVVCLRWLLLLLTALLWFLAMATLLVAVNVNAVLQPEMLWFSLVNASELAGVFASAVSPFWQTYTVLLTLVWLLLAFFVQFALAKNKPLKPVKTVALYTAISAVSLLLVSEHVLGNKGAYKGQLLSFWVYSPAALPNEQTNPAAGKFNIGYLAKPSASLLNNTSYDTVVLLILESARADWLERKHNMPNLQAFANESLKFTNAYTTVSHSSKALYSIFCGVYPAPVMQIIEAEKNHKAYCLGHWMQDAGFTSLFLQSAMGSFENRQQFTKNLGFENFLAGEDLARLGAKKFAYLAYDDAYLPEMLEQQLPQYQGQKLFLSLFSSNTHHPYYSDSKPCTLLPEQCYRQTAEKLDQTFAQLQQVVNSHRKPQRTLWLVLGDHGEAFGEKGKIWHDAVPYEEVVNIPLLIKGATIAPGQDYKLRSLIDIPLTVIDLLQQQQGPKTWSMAKSLLNPQGHEAIFSYCFYPKSCRSIRTPTKKIILDEKFGKHQQAPIGSQGQVLENQLQPLQKPSVFINQSEQLKQQLRKFYSQ